MNLENFLFAPFSNGDRMAVFNYGSQRANYGMRNFNCTHKLVLIS